ncbi:ABC transporter ATP-binding protein [Streptomyces agglomeratus]|uniref:ABC transporter ATP-binding protein n=1 Tax=Streptomyces agglomeratus TaxID=285458 RepID=UPI000854F9A9|nr:ABC transporter ATP-binding protein [Streptomyces agglomeratus]OEJ36368.1 ABC transporter [Streptomyces agglomeratus]
MDTASTAVSLDAVEKVYKRGSTAVAALAGVSLAFQKGTFTAVMGPSGSGKSTLLHCAAGLDEPTAGSITIDGVDLRGKSETELTLLRRDKIGFIFQAFNLLPALTVTQNILLPLQLAGRRVNKNLVQQVIQSVGLAERAHHRPSELSGGQQQRVAIARALVAQPAVIFADEPTGALDTRTAGEVLTLLQNAVHQSGQTIVMVTHDPVAASYADRVVFLADGRIASEMYRPTASAVAEQMTHLGDAVAGRPLLSGGV